VETCVPNSDIMTFRSGVTSQNAVGGYCTDRQCSVL